MADEHIGSGDDLTPEHLLGLVSAYEKVLDHLGYAPVAYPDTSERCGSNVLSGAKYDCLNHAYWMCGRIRAFVGAHRMSKALRWLGTIQGMLIMGGVFSVDEIMAHDREIPDPREIARRWRDD